jgi:RNA polymerase sigma-70 factor (ECF subfamily)
MAKAKFNPSEDRFTRGIIRRKVKQLIGVAGFTKQNREDLEQELFARVVQSLPKFDPDQAHRNKFVTTVVERYVANILRNKRAAKRDDQGVTSLNVMIEITEEGPTELAQTIGEREMDSRLGRDRRSEEELTQLALDLADVIATLPESWQTLLELRKTQTMQEVADEMGVPRTTLNGWMRRIRQRFEKTGMQDYLES